MSTTIIDVAEQTSSYMDNAYEVDESVSEHVFGNSNANASSGNQLEKHSTKKFRTNQEDIQGKAELYMEHLDTLKVQIAGWETAESTANQMLWNVLSFAYTVYRGIYKASSRAIKDKITETLREKLDDKGVVYNKSARAVTLTVIYAFGKETPQTKRYAQALQTAQDDSIDVVDFPAYIDELGGVDGIINSKRTGGKTTQASKVKIEAARLEAQKQISSMKMTPLHVVSNSQLSSDAEAVLFYGVVNGANVHIVSKLEIKDPEKNSMYKYFRNKLAEQLINPPAVEEPKEDINEGEMEGANV